MAVKRLTIEDIKQRIELAKEMMLKFVATDVTNTRKFLDPAIVADVALSGDTPINIADPDVDQTAPIGLTNLLTQLILAKQSVLGINRPDWHVTAMMPELGPDGEPTGKTVPDPDSAQIWREYMIKDWDRKNHQRTAQKVLLKRGVAGLGCVAWSWGDTGAEFEHVQSWDYGVDPFVTDWQNVEYGRRRIRMSLRKAAEDYPKGPFKDMIGQESPLADKKIIEIEVYWDKDTEAHVYEDQWLIHKDVANNADPKANLYNRVPLLFLEGDLHPNDGRTPFPVGDSTLAAAAQAELSDLSQSVSNTAKAGAGFTLFDSADEVINKAAIEAIEKGEQQQFIGVKGLDTNSLPVYRVPGEELRPAVLDARKECKDDMMALVGVSSSDLGLYGDRPEFATQVAVTNARGGARQNQGKADYETFLNRWGSITLDLYKAFGGPVRDRTTGEVISSQDSARLHEAAMRVTEIKILEGSTVYKDPSAQQQQSMQLLQLVMTNMPVLVNLANMGLIDSLPDVKMLWNKLFRAFDINQTDQLWQPYQAPQAPPQDQDKPKVSINYADLPDDTKRSAEAAAGLQPSQTGTPEEAPDMSPHVDLEKQARDHLHEVGLKQMDNAHALQLAQLNAVNAANTAKITASSRTNGTNGSGGSNGTTKKNGSK